MKLRQPLLGFVVIGVLAAAPPAGADIGSAPLQNWRFSGNGPFAAKRVGRTLYVGGDFDAVAPAANDVGGFVALAPSGTPSRRGPRLDGAGVAMTDDGAGGAFVVGAVLGSNGLNTYTLTHVLADGSVAAGFQPAVNGQVVTLARVGTTLYIGGLFTAVNGQARGRGAAFDIVSGALLAWNPQVNNGLLIAISDAGPGRVYIGGTFNNVAGVLATGLVRVTATTGAIDAFIDVSISPSSGYVTTLLTHNGTLYVGGVFDGIGGSPRLRLGAIDLGTSMVTPFVANVTGFDINALSAQGARLFVGGAFSAINGTPRLNLAQLDAASGAVTQWQAQVSAVQSLLTVGNTLYLGGDFTTVNGQPRAHIAALDVTGGTALVTPWNPGLTAKPFALLAGLGGDVLVAGSPMAYGARARDGLAAIDVVTGDLLSFAPRLESHYVTVIEATPAAVYFGGAFATVEGVPRTGLAAVDPQGHVLPWNPGNASVDAAVILAAGPTVFVGGRFATLGTQSRANLAAVDAVTGAATAWRVNVTDRVTRLQLVGTTLYASGDFTAALSGNTLVTRNGVAAFDAVTAALLPFAPVIAGGAVRDIHVAGPLLYLAGAFATVGGQSRPYIAAVDRTSGAVAPFAPAVNDVVDRVTERDGTVFLAGNFTAVNAVPRLGQAAVGAGAATTTTPFNPGLGTLGGWVAWEAGPDSLLGLARYLSGHVYVFPDGDIGGVPGPPSAPRAVVAGATLSLDWQPAPFGARPTSYVLDASLAPGAPPFGSLPVGANASFTTGGVPPGIYYLSARAISAAGSSVSSPQVGVAVGVPGCSAPPAPPDLAATTGVGAVTLQWSPSSGLATDYTLLAGTRAGAGDLGALAVGGTRTLSGAAPAGVYYARVVASGPCGISSASSEVVMAVDVAAPPAAPLVTAQVNGSTVALAWDAVPGARSYRLEVGTGPLLSNLGVVSTTATSLAANAVPPGTYFVRVTAVGATAESARPGETVLLVMPPHLVSQPR